MTPVDFAAAMASAVGAVRLRHNCPLASFTTFRVGGPAEWLFEARTSDEILMALTLAYRAGVPVTMLGGGSNVLVSDVGVRGLVIRARGGDIQRTDANRVRADAAVTINGLVRWTIMHGCSGLEAWAGTPGTVGGAVYGNAHFAGSLVGDLMAAARLATRTGATIDVRRHEMAFGYDDSRLQKTGEVLLWAEFEVADGDPALLRKTARESLAFRKRTQPLDTPSAGCIFQNPQPGRDTVPDGIPWSAGALIDRAGLKGAAVGGARVSPTHGNFIVNDGQATAHDVRELIARCRTGVQAQFGVELREEIVYLGDW